MKTSEVSEKRIMLIILAAVLCIIAAPLAYAALSDYVEPLKGLDIPLGSVLQVHQRDLYNEKVIQLTLIYRNGYRVANRMNPRPGSPEFGDEIKQKLIDYEDAIKIYESVIDMTKNEMQDSRMKTLHDDSASAASSLREKLGELREAVGNDDANCIGDTPACRADGQSPSYCTGIEKLFWGWWGGDCAYDGEEYQPEINTENVDELRDEARGKTKWPTYYYVIIVLVIIFLFGAFLKKKGWLGHAAFALGWIGRGAALLLTGALLLLLRMLRALVRYLRRRAGGGPPGLPAGPPAAPPGGPPVAPPAPAPAPAPGPGPAPPAGP